MAFRPQPGWPTASLRTHILTKAVFQTCLNAQVWFAPWLAVQFLGNKTSPEVLVASATAFALWAALTLGRRRALQDQRARDEVATEIAEHPTDMEFVLFLRPFSESKLTSITLR